jgi:hypothetical protein
MGSGAGQVSVAWRTKVHPWAGAERGRVDGYCETADCFRVGLSNDPILGDNLIRNGAFLFADEDSRPVEGKEPSIFRGWRIFFPYDRAVCKRVVIGERDLRAPNGERAVRTEGGIAFTNGLSMPGLRG